MNVLKKIGNFVWSKAFGIQIGVLFVFYIALFFSVKGCLKSQTNFGEKIAVPNLIGKNANNAKFLLKDSGLEFEILDSIYKPELVEGTILEQDPMPTSISQVHVKHTHKVRLRVSKRTQLVEMPNLVSRSQRYATVMLENLEFRYKFEYVPSKEAANSILEQHYNGKPIKPGSKIPIGSMIKLIIGQDQTGVPVQLPNLYGKTVEEAELIVRGIGDLAFHAAYAGCANYSDSSRARITTQKPAFSEGAIVLTGSTITVVATNSSEPNTPNP